MTKTKVTVLSSSAGPTPHSAMTTPARPGPMRRPRLNDAEFSETALVSLSSGTISETNACRAGLSMAVDDALEERDRVDLPELRGAGDGEDAEQQARERRAGSG